jgi:hypothetical protein
LSLIIKSWKVRPFRIFMVICNGDDNTSGYQESINQLNMSYHFPYSTGYVLLVKDGKGTYIWALCQKNEGSLKIKQRPVKMDGRTTYWTLPPKRTPFQNGVDRWPNLWTVPGRRWNSPTYLMRLWGHSYFKISSPGPVFMEPNDYYDAPINRDLHFIRSVGLIKS